MVKQEKTIMKFHNSQKEELDILDYYGCCVEATKGRTYYKTKIFNEEGKNMYTFEQEGHIFY